MRKSVVEKNCIKFSGCDFVVVLDEGRKNTPIKLLQLTDMQIIDSMQRRTPDRLRPDEIEAWLPENFDAQCGNHIRSLVNQTHPDLIFITGDVVYGSFDDKGTTFEWFCKLMDSFEIPWALTWGNHDNECAKGVSWQCDQLINSKHCLFKRGNVTGNSNYSVGIAVGDELIRVLHLVDTNGCDTGNDESIMEAKGIYPDQLEIIKKNTELITVSQGKRIPAFMACHISVDCFDEAQKAKGYKTDDRRHYILGVTVDSQDNDFGFNLEGYYDYIKTDGHFIDFLKEQNVDGVFFGHSHKINTSISYKDIIWTFGMKTGQYDYHELGAIGGTLITLNGDKFKVSHVPSLVPLSPMPSKAPMFKNFLLTGV